MHNCDVQEVVASSCAEGFDICGTPGVPGGTRLNNWVPLGYTRIFGQQPRRHIVAACMWETRTIEGDFACEEVIAINVKGPVQNSRGQVVKVGTRGVRQYKQNHARKCKFLICLCKDRQGAHQSQSLAPRTPSEDRYALVRSSLRSWESKRQR